MPSPLGHNRNDMIMHLASELRPQLSLDVWGSVVKGALRTANMNLAKSVQSLADSACEALDDVRLDMACKNACLLSYGPQNSVRSNIWPLRQSDVSCSSLTLSTRSCA